MMIPDRRFRPEPMTAIEVIEWLKTHNYVWYQAPMETRPYRLSLTSKIRAWKRTPERFEFSVEFFADGFINKIRVDNSHLDRLVLPFELWHHGITANVSHVRYMGDSKRHIVLNQSNGYHLSMKSLEHAIHFAEHQAMELTAHYGKRTRVLVPARAPISGERTF